MTAESVFLAAILLAAMVSFYLQRVRADVTALLVMLALLVPWRPGPNGLEAILSPVQAFHGFGSPALVMVASMFVLSAAMVRTGAAALLGGRLLSRSATSELRFQLTILVMITGFSAVINNTTTVLVWMPPVMAICRERGYSPSRVLMLLAFGSLLGGQWTLIGTRSNVILSDFLADTPGGSGFGFFAFTPLAALVFLACGAWFVLAGRRFLPRGESKASLESRYEVAEFLTETMAETDSEYVGKTLKELDLAEKDVSLLQVIRDKEFLPPSPWLRVQPGDVLVIQGRITAITDVITSPGMKVREELKINDKTLRSADLRMVEAILPPDSGLVQRSLRDVDFHHRYGVSPLAISRAGRSIRERPSRVTLRSGDSLLLVGHETEIQRLRRNPDLLLLESRPLPNARPRSAIVLLLILFLMVVSGAFGWLSPATTIPMAAMAAVLSGCVGLRSAYEAIDLPTLIIVGAMIPFGEALQTTGTAELFAGAIADFAGADSPHLTLGVLLLLALILTQIIENAAVAVLLAPLAYEMALASDADPRPYFLGICVCISASFITPIAHESTLLVMGPGRYRFRDYVVLGLPFAVITWLVATLATPLIWPLTK